MIETARFGLINRWKSGDWNRTKRENSAVCKCRQVLESVAKNYCNVLHSISLRTPDSKNTTIFAVRL